MNDRIKFLREETVSGRNIPTEIACVTCAAQNTGTESAKNRMIGLHAPMRSPINASLRGSKRR